MSDRIIEFGIKTIIAATSWGIAGYCVLYYATSL
jgi:hypothetical protein